MEANVVQKITELALAGRDLPQRDHPGIVLPSADGGWEVQSLEHLEDQPYRQRVRYRTNRISDFVRYVEAEALEAETAVFVRPEGGGGVAIIDFGSHSDPRWGEHRAHLDMKRTPEYLALLQVVERHQPQRGLIEFLEDWRDLISPYARALEEGGQDEFLSVGQAITSVRRIEVKGTESQTTEDEDFRKIRSAMETVEARSRKGQLPAGFTFTCKPYPELQQRNIDVRISMLTTQNTPHFSLRIVGQGALDEAVAEEVELDITSRLNQKARVFVGAV